MNKRYFKSILTTAFIAGLIAGGSDIPLTAQLPTQFGTISGNFQIDGQYYNSDSLIGAAEIDQRFANNSFLNLIYQNGSLTAGVRYETYQPPIAGFDPRLEGSGIPYRYVRYAGEFADITVGNFYEQFGSGMILRSYEDWQLGFDNTIDGVRAKLFPLQGVTVTGLIGKMRSFQTQGAGVVRGLDVDVNMNTLLGEGMDDIRLSLGGSFVSKFQDDRDPIRKLPENVGAYAGRINLGIGKFTLFGEYAHKINDPVTTNRFVYNTGSGLYVNASYSDKGIGALLSFKRIDNMDFRADRAAVGNNLNINYLPALTRQHTYRLPTLYPYATQLNGEIGVQAEVIYTFPRNSFFGGKYGSTISVNYSRIHQLDTSRIDDFSYESRFWSAGDRLYFQDFNVEFVKRWTRELKTIFAAIFFSYDRDQIEGTVNYGLIHSNVFVGEVSYQIDNKNSFRVEMQHLAADKANDLNLGNWVFGLAEYALDSKWFFTVLSEYNYGNDNPDRRLNYTSGNVVYAHNGYRLSLSYGRQRGGFLCVGGVCRFVPAANGLSLSFFGTF